MKKCLIIFSLSFFLININYLEAYAKKYRVNDLVENNFFINKKVKLNLPKGKWIVSEVSYKNISGIQNKRITLTRSENKKLIEIISIFEWNTQSLNDSRYKYLVDEVIYKALFNNRTDSCYEKQEYTVIKFYKKGSSHNCFWVGHYDLKKYIYETEVFYIYPGVSDLRTEKNNLIRWLKKNQIILPNVALYSQHSYFSRVTGGKWFGLTRIIDPKILNAPENKFITVESSEYHANNIKAYPHYKKIMNNWVSISAKQHIDFENSIKVKKRQKLDLNDISLIKTNDANNTSNNFTDQLQTLTDLFNNGSLTKEEFEKAKKKLLN
jgi:hypothetical protein